MYQKEEEIRNELILLKEEKYQKFSSSLIPGVNNLLGVRVPIIRKIAQRLIKNKEVEYLEKAEDIYFEETMLKGLMIGNIKGEIEDVLKEVELFIPKINNWSICDSFCSELKIVRKNKEKVWSFLEKYYSSEEVYEIRFAVVLMLFHFIEEEYIDNILAVCDIITNEEYYVKMAVAWCLSICYVKFPEKTHEYLLENNLDDETFNKTIQKIRESFRVDKEAKEKLNKLKRKKKKNEF